MVAGAFPQQSLKISPKKDQCRNYLNREAKVPLTQRSTRDDLFLEINPKHMPEFTQAERQDMHGSSD